MIPTVHLVDDDESFRRSMARRLSGLGFTVATHASVAEFLERLSPDSPGCVLTDLQMPQSDGFDLQEALADSTNPLPVVFVTGKGDIPTSVRAMRGGAEDFLTKRVHTPQLVGAIERAIARDSRERQARQRQTEARQRVESLNRRQLQMLLGVFKGMHNREMADAYEMSERTVKYHRTMLTRHLDIHTSVDLVRLVQDAGITTAELAKMAADAPPEPQMDG